MAVRKDSANFAAAGKDAAAAGQFSLLPAHVPGAPVHPPRQPVQADLFPQASQADLVQLAPLAPTVADA